LSNLGFGKQKTRSFKQIIAEYWSRFQASLFPFLSGVVEEPLTGQLEKLVVVWDIVEIEEHVGYGHGSWTGRPEHDRRKMARAFVAKSVYNLTTTEAMIELLRTHRALRRLCGYVSIREIPSSATFSRAFKEFSDAGLGDVVHKHLVAKYIGDQIVMHNNRDSTEVVARERPAQKEKEKGTPVQEKRKRGRPKKGEASPPKEEKRLDIQLRQTAELALAEISKVCNWGSKKDTGGHMHSWKGYKAHIDWADDGVPINVVTTSASVHDSQVAIPMARVSAERANILYELMDSAYDAPQIRTAIESLGHVAIIDANPRRGGVPEEKIFDPATAKRYNERTTAERGNSRLKDEFGLRNLRVRGHAKAHLHIMFGVLALFANQIARPIKG
jgi:hypothetical protein